MSEPSQGGEGPQSDSGHGRRASPGANGTPGGREEKESDREERDCGRREGGAGREDQGQRRNGRESPGQFVSDSESTFARTSVFETVLDCEFVFPSDLTSELEPVSASESKRLV